MSCFSVFFIAKKEHALFFTGPHPQKYFDPQKLKSLKGTNAVYVEQLKDLVKSTFRYRSRSASMQGTTVLFAPRPPGPCGSVNTPSPEVGLPLMSPAKKPPRINMLGLSKALKIEAFTGDASTTFSYWYRRYSDYGDAQPTAWTDEQKAIKIKFFLDGLAREKYEEIPTVDRKILAVVVAKLREWFESPKLRTLARHSLSQCKQLSGESVNDFVQRLSQAVKAATIGQTNASVKERLLEEFLDKLNPDIAFHVKCTDPDTFETAHLKAQQVESLLAFRAASKTSNSPLSFSCANLSHLSTQAHNGVSDSSRSLQRFSQLEHKNPPQNHTTDMLSEDQQPRIRFGPNSGDSRHTYSNRSWSPHRRFPRNAKSAQNWKYFDNEDEWDQCSQDYEPRFPKERYCSLCGRYGHVERQCYDKGSKASSRSHERSGYVNALSLTSSTSGPLRSSHTANEKFELLTTVEHLQHVNLGLRKQNEQLAKLLDPRAVGTRH